MRIGGLFAAVALCVAAACREAPAERTNAELLGVLATVPEGVAEDVWDDVRAFYAAREQAYAWATAERPDERARAALAALREIDTHGLNPDEYGVADLSARHSRLGDREPRESSDSSSASQQAQAIAGFDVDLTVALLRAARHVAIGRHDPSVIDSRWNASRDAPDYGAALSQAHAEGVRSVFDRVQPRHPEYGALRNTLASLRGQAVQGWPEVPNARLERGKRHEAVRFLRQRLRAAGHLSSSTPPDSLLFDAEVESAVRAFQEHHGLEATGTLDPATLEAMNVPLEARVRQVAMNLERWRWLPDALGDRHLLVNVPHFHLLAREQGRTVMDIRTVVGTPSNETPLFSDEMTHVVFSPYWNIPETIALEETAPAIARDPEYLTRNNMEVVDASGRVVAPSEVLWDDREALADLSFRQRPGPKNALGHVKFMFPNRHAVYIHDTPADALFRRIGRAFSHGCVRVEEPETLAQYVLRDQPEWTPEKIRAAMRAGEPQRVPLTQPLPVHIVYMTAWVDERGGLHFQKDVYGYDARQSRSF